MSLEPGRTGPNSTEVSCQSLRPAVPTVVDRDLLQLDLVWPARSTVCTCAQETSRPLVIEVAGGNDLPAGLAAPARRALASAGITRLEDVARLQESELKALHGMGPKAVNQLRDALASRGLAFKDAEEP